MSAYGRVRISLIAASALLLMQSPLALSESAGEAANGSAKPTPTYGNPERDGQRDFDWMHGTWKATLKRLEKPLTGSTTWVEFEGTQITRPFWNGLANMDEFVVENPTTHIRGLTLRLYNPKTKEWSLYWANANAGVMAMPPTVGRFDGKGRGEFYDREDWNGRPIIVRYVWSNITKTAAHFEQSFSADDGKTWEVNWISDLSRLKE